MIPRRILFGTNARVVRCGVAEFGRSFCEALTRAGHTVTVWDLGPYGPDTPPVIWPRAADYDLAIINWHPFALRGDATRLPAALPTWVYQHDIYPHSICPWAASGFWSAEPCPTTICHPYPIIDWPLQLQRPDPSRVVIGSTSLRGDGVDTLRAYCAKRGYEFNASGPAWRSMSEEVVRLSRSTLNVCWYHASGRGQSLALSTCLGAGRPILLNDSAMFSLATGAPLFRGHGTSPEDVARDVSAALRATQTHDDAIQHPWYLDLQRRYSWTATLARMADEWEAAL